MAPRIKSKATRSAKPKTKAKTTAAKAPPSSHLLRTKDVKMMLSGPMNKRVSPSSIAAANDVYIRILRLLTSTVVEGMDGTGTVTDAHVARELMRDPILTRWTRVHFAYPDALTGQPLVKVIKRLQRTATRTAQRVK